MKLEKKRRILNLKRIKKKEIIITITYKKMKKQIKNILISKKIWKNT